MKSSYILLVLSIIEPLSASEALSKHPTIQAMLRENNRIRIKEKLEEHRISAILTSAAQDQAIYMARTHDFEHLTKTNDSPGVRAARYGYSGLVRENLGRKYKTIARVFYEWAESPEHWESIIGDFIEVGFGYAIAEDGTQYWVSLYGTPKGPERWEKVLSHGTEVSQLTPLQLRLPPFQSLVSRSRRGSSLNFLLIEKFRK